MWTVCAESIRAQVSDAVWRTTFSGAKAVAFDEGELVIVVPNGLQKERIEGRYLGLVQDAIEDIESRFLGREGMLVEYPVGEQRALVEALELLRQRKWDS